MSGNREPIGVIGTGYVGLVTAAGFAELGSEVWCVDIDAEKIARLRRGEVPIYEPGLEELLLKHSDRLRFSTDIADALEHARLLFVAVGTPPTYSGDADLSAVNAVVDAIPASDHHALVMKSTVPCGTGAAIERVFEQQGKGSLAYVSCPEFLKEGSAVKDFLEPDRVVVGDHGDWAGDAVVELYAPLNAPLVRTDIASAEMVKLASNAFLATKISFINEIANVCEQTGADVIEVARGMGLDDRIGSKFLQAGIGFGGSCLAGEETLLVREHGRTKLLSFAQLWERLDGEHPRADADEAVAAYGAGRDTEVIEPVGVQVLSWDRRTGTADFHRVLAATRRPHDGELLEVRTKMGRRLRTTLDHPWIVGDGHSDDHEVKLAFELTNEDWVPIVGSGAWSWDEDFGYPLGSALESAGLTPANVLSRPPAGAVAELARRPVAERREVFTHPRGVAARTGDVKRSGTLRLDEVMRADLPWEWGTIGTASNGAFSTPAIAIDAAFWRVLGLYLAEGCASMCGDTHVGRITWSFHPSKEQHLVDEVTAFWLRHGVAARAESLPTTHKVTVQSRILASFWTDVLGMGRTSYAQRLPDLIWEAPDEHKWALLSGLFEGDGSWSLVNGGPSVIIELGTVSDELADGVLRLLADLGVAASRRIGRVAKSTKDTHWIRISGAEQVERAIALVRERDRSGALTSIALQQRRIAPTGYRRFADGGPAWVRISDVRRTGHQGHVYSLEVPATHTVVTTAGLATHNCFPKDVDALKQLAGNSGYHFQLLTAVIEVNELQKRRVISKLVKHLGGLVGKRVALLGLAFKPNTDDMREASSLVLSARLHADGASVSAYDPVAEDEARALMPGLEFAGSALEALEGADAVVLVTEWSEFTDLDWAEVAARMSGTLVVDGRNALDADAIRGAGLIYEGIGRGG
jgi:UDPglucose 6-dehydrogenase